MLQLSEQARDEVVDYMLNSSPRRATVVEANQIINYLRQLQPIPEEKEQHDGEGTVA